MSTRTLNQILWYVCDACERSGGYGANWGRLEREGWTRVGERHYCENCQGPAHKEAEKHETT